MFFEVEILAANNPDTFGKAGAFAQAYSLFDGALGLATFVGPAWGGWVFESTGWSVCMLTLAGLCVVAGWPVWIYTGSPRKENGKAVEAESETEVSEVR